MVFLLIKFSFLFLYYLRIDHFHFATESVDLAMRGSYESRCNLQTILLNSSCQVPALLVQPIWSSNEDAFASANSWDTLSIWNPSVTGISFHNFSWHSWIFKVWEPAKLRGSFSRRSTRPRCPHGGMRKWVGYCQLDGCLWSCELDRFSWVTRPLYA